MTIIAPFSEQLSEQWLLERTYHAQLRNGEELSVPDLTRAMKQLIDFDVPPSSQSSKSKLPERASLKKSSNFSVPLSTWREVSQEEARTTYQQGIPILLFSEHASEHPKGGSGYWSASKNMRVIINGDEREHLGAVSGTDYAVCYLDLQRGTFSNASWRKWFSADCTILESSDHSDITFLVPCMQFPSTTHYTVIAADGQVYEYAGRAEAIQHFHTLPPQQVSNGSAVQTVFPQFCYYHEVTCPSGVYRLEFFGPRMDERGYEVRGTAFSGRERTQEVLA
ncbi:MAG TPA: hypothetical protein VFA09_13875 [Ktedonobacteraceae bacterium]|nr:hypothetical protein [Ktedonobacteraceae bacterium]HZU68359.1 hypothetical protein [Ktedonobacteraceae bacterium]